MRSIALLLTSAGLLACAGGHAHHKTSADHVHPGPAQHRFDDAEQWARVFEDPGRDEWQKPDKVIAALKIPDGAARVADIGAATGYFPVRIARAHPEATVYGVDLEPDMVAYLAERARREGLSNLQAVQGEPADPRLPGAVDVILLVDTYHHIEDRPAYFEKLRKQLRPGGRVAIVDFKLGAAIGPPDEHKLPPEQVNVEMGQAGYELRETHDFLPHQYFLIFEPVIHTRVTLVP